VAGGSGGNDAGTAGEDATPGEAGTPPPPDAPNGCSCALDPASRRDRGGAIAALAVVALALVRRRRRRGPLLKVVTLALIVVGALARPVFAAAPEAGGNTAASAATGVGALETSAKPTAAQPRWHGSVLLFDQSMTTQTAGIGADYQSANPTYEWWIAFKPQVFLFERPKDRLSVNLWTNLYLELTNSDTTTGRHELLLGPTYLWSSYARTLVERGGYKTTLTAGPRLTLPTDRAARAAGQYFILGASLGGAQAFPLRGKNVRVLRGLRLGASAVYNRLFWAANTPTNDEIHQLRQDLGSRTIIDDQLRGTLNPKHALNLYFTGDLQILSRLSFAASYVVLQQWSYDPTPAMVQTGTGPAVVGPGIPDPTNYRVTTWLTSSFDYSLTNELLVSLGYLNRALQLAPDGTRRNPLWSPEARLFLTVTCRLDAFYGRVTHRPFAAE
jgi:MYXO-CTERM domain-containing protein